MGKIWNILIGRSTKELNSENALVDFPNKEKGENMGDYGEYMYLYIFNSINRNELFSYKVFFFELLDQI